MKEMLIKAKEKFKRKIRMASIISTLAIHLLYISYLTYSLINDIGIKAVNIALISGTSLFLIAYLFLQLVGEDRKIKLKNAKKIYKRFKLATKAFTTATAIYSLATAAGSVSPIAIALSGIGAIFLVLRIISEMLVSFISNRAKKFKESIKNKREEKKIKKMLDEIEITEESCELTEEDFKIIN